MRFGKCNNRRFCVFVGVAVNYTRRNKGAFCSMTYFIMADDPQTDANEARRRLINREP